MTFDEFVAEWEKQLHEIGSIVTQEAFDMAEEAYAAGSAQSLDAVLDPYKAHIERLRKALDVYRNVADPADWSNRPAEAALAATPAQSLASIRNQVRDECIEIIACNLIGFADDDEDLNNMIAKIRAMKEPE